MQPTGLAVRSHRPSGRRYKKTAIQAIIGLIVIIFVATVAFTVGHQAQQETGKAEPMIKTGGVNLMPEAIAQLPSDYAGMAVEPEPEPVKEMEPVKEAVTPQEPEPQVEQKEPSRLERLLEERQLAMLEESWEAADSGGAVEGLSEKVKELRPISAINADDYNYLNHKVVDQVSPYVVTQGTVIPAILITGINSDLASPITATIRENVYDSVTGEYLLLPQGSKLIGTYNDAQVYNQERVFIAWNRIIMPNGTSIKLGDMTGVDMSGYAGLRDGVDPHTWALVKGVILSTFLSAGANISTADNDTAASFQRGFAQGTNRAMDDVVQRSLNVQPTITIRPGARLNVFVQKDMILRPYQD